MDTLAKLKVASVVAACVQMLSGAEITWGGSSGRWHDKANWEGGQKPVAADTVLFPATGKYAVEIDEKTAELLYVKVLPGSAEDVVTFTDDDPTDETFRSLFVDGDGYDFAIGENRKVKIAGSRLYLGDSGVKTYADIGLNAELSIDDGKLYIESGGILVNTNATLKVCGGSIEYKDTRDYLKLAKGATVVFNGGSNVVGRIANCVKVNDEGVLISEFDGDGSKLAFADGYTEFPDAFALTSYVDWSKTLFEFTGGTLCITSRIKTAMRSLLPPKGGMLINHNVGLSMTDEGSADNVWRLGGKAFFTSEDSYVNLGWGTNMVIKGGGGFAAASLHQGPRDVYADLGRIDLAADFESSSNGGHLYLQDGITFGAYGDVGVNPKKSARFVPCGRVKFDTVDSKDGASLRSFDLASRFDFSNVTSFEVEGAGMVGAVPEAAFKYLRRFSVDAGATVALTNANARLVASVFNLGAGAMLLVGSNVVDVASAAWLDEGAKIRYGFGSLEVGTMYPLWFGPHGTEPPVSSFEFEPALPEGWFVAVHGSTAYLSDGTVHEVDSMDIKAHWIGSEGGNWNISANWTTNGTAGNVPGGSVSLGATFSGNRQLAVTNDWPKDFAWMRNISAAESAGPYVISGKPFSLIYPQNWTDSGSSVANSSRFPFVLESKLFKHWVADNTQRSYFNVLANSDAPIVMTGGGSLTNAVFRFRGDVRIGGEWETLGLFPASGGGRDTRFVLLPGANLHTTEQGSNQTVTASYQVSANAGMSINGTVWRWTTKENTHFVDGVVTSTCPVQATARQTFIGDGILSLAMVQSDAAGTGDLKFAEEITVRPAGWKTVRAGADNPMTMVVRGNATIGAWGDWAYGAEDGFESSTAAADRALKVVGGAKTRVSFDTEGNTITLKDPIVVEKWSTVIKKGEGALALASEENDLADSEIELLGGELRLSAPHAFGKLTFAGGKIAIEDGFNADAYTPVFTAKKIVGEVAVAGRFAVKTATDGNGVTVSVRRKRGAAVILR